MCSCTPNSPEDAAEEALNAARRFFAEGKFEEALEKHVWFHDHALHVRPSYYGVRLSFALSDWIKLGKKYPKALTTLEGIRDRITAQLLRGKAERELFHDAASINAHRDESRATVEIFKKLDGAQPEFASTVYDLAEESLIAAGEYGLARKYLGDPMKRLTVARQPLDEGLEYAASSRSEVCRKAFENIFAEDTVRVIKVLDKTGDAEMARKVQSQALAILDSPTIRSAIELI